MPIYTSRGFKEHRDVRFVISIFCDTVTKIGKKHAVTTVIASLRFATANISEMRVQTAAQVEYVPREMEYWGRWSCNSDDLASSILEDHNFAIHHFSSIQAFNVRRIQRVQFNLHRTRQCSHGNETLLYRTCRFSINERPRTTSKWGSSERYTVCEVDTWESSRSP